jgi:hypothetical protein
MSERDGYKPGVPCWVDTWQPDAGRRNSTRSCSVGRPRPTPLLRGPWALPTAPPSRRSVGHYWRARPRRRMTKSWGNKKRREEESADAG